MILRSEYSPTLTSPLLCCPQLPSTIIITTALLARVLGKWIAQNIFDRMDVSVTQTVNARLSDKADNGFKVINSVRTSHRSWCNVISIDPRPSLIRVNTKSVKPESDQTKVMKVQCSCHRELWDQRVRETVYCELRVGGNMIGWRNIFI